MADILNLGEKHDRQYAKRLGDLICTVLGHEHAWEHRETIQTEMRDIVVGIEAKSLDIAASVTPASDRRRVIRDKGIPETKAMLALGFLLVRLANVDAED